MVACGRVAWSDAFCSAYSSAWSLFEIYRQLNLTSGAELIEPLKDNERWWSSPPIQRSFLKRGWLIVPPKGVGRTGYEPALYRFLDAWHRASPEAFLNPWLEEVADDSRLRICPACAELAYQSVFDQLLGLERCPIHGVPYLTICPTCGAPLGSYHFDPSADVACGRCGRPHLLTTNARALRRTDGFRQKEQDAWSAFAAWWHRLQSKPYYPLVRAGAFPRRTSESEALPTGVRFLWVLNEIESLPRDIKPFLAPRPKTLNTTIIHDLPSLGTKCVRPWVDHAEVMQRFSVLRSIGRHLRRTFIRGHERCLKSARDRFWTFSVGGGLEAPLQEGGCHVAQAYLYWCRSWLSNVPRGQGDLKALKSRFGSGTYEDDIRIWARQVLAGFHERFLAIRLNYQIIKSYKKKMQHAVLSNPEVLDAHERLLLQWHMATTFIGIRSVRPSLQHGVVILVGRGPDLRRLYRRSPACCRKQRVHRRVL